MGVCFPQEIISAPTAESGVKPEDQQMRKASLIYSDLMVWQKLTGRLLKKGKLFSDKQEKTLELGTYFSIGT